MSFVVAENLLKQMGQEWTTAEIKDVAAFDCASYLYNLTSDSSEVKLYKYEAQSKAATSLISAVVHSCPICFSKFSATTKLISSSAPPSVQDDVHVSRPRLLFGLG